MQALEETIISRRAVRKFKKDPVPPELLEQVFELARWMPVIDAFHSWQYYVVSGKKRDEAMDIISRNTIHLRDLLENMDEANKEKALHFYPDLGGAPVIVFQTIPKIESEWQRKYAQALAGMSMYLFMLGVHRAGLASCGVTLAPWIEEKLMEQFGIEDSEVVFALAIGYADEEPKTPKKSPERVTYL